MVSRAPFHQCVECDDIITNPICGDCLAKEMRVMLQEYDPALAETISYFAIEGEMQCIFCKQKMALCAHCFSKDVHEYLKEKNPTLASEFVSRFDFDLRQNLPQDFTLED